MDFESEYEQQRQRKLEQLRQIDRQQTERFRAGMQQAVLDKVAAEKECERLRKLLEEAEGRLEKARGDLEQQSRSEAELRLLLDVLGGKVRELEDRAREKDEHIRMLGEREKGQDNTRKGLEQQIEQLQKDREREVRTMMDEFAAKQRRFTQEMGRQEQKYRQIVKSKDDQLSRQSKISRQNLQSQLTQLTKAFQEKQSQQSKTTRRMQLQNKRLLDQSRRLLTQISTLKQSLLQMQQKLTNDSLTLRLRSKQRDYEMETIKKQLEFERQERQNQKERMRNAIEDRELARREAEEVRKKAREDMRAVKEKMEEEFKGYQREAEKIETALKRELEDTRSANRQLTDLCAALKEEKQELLTELKKGKEEQGVKLANVKETEKREWTKLQRQLERKERELQQQQKDHQATKNKMDKILLKFDQILGKRNQIQKENKMLLSQIVFWRDKNKGMRKSNKSQPTPAPQDKPPAPCAPQLDDLKSQQSRDYTEVNQLQKQIQKLKAELETYKALIKQMEKDITYAVEKLDAKNEYIAILEIQIRKLQQALPKTSQFKRMSNESIFSLPKYDSFEKVLEQNQH